MYFLNKFESFFQSHPIYMGCIILFLGACSEQDIEYLPEDISIPCHESNMIEEWTLDTFNSMYTIRYPDIYHRAIEGPIGNKFAIFKDSGNTRIIGGFCHPYVDPCENATLEYYDYFDSNFTISYPPPDSTKSYIVYSENLLKGKFRVCENEETTVQFYYIEKGPEEDSMIQGILYFKTPDCDPPCMRLGGFAYIDFKNKEEAFQIIQTLKRY